MIQVNIGMNFQGTGFEVLSIIKQILFYFLNYESQYSHEIMRLCISEGVNISKKFYLFLKCKAMDLCRISKNSVKNEYIIILNLNLKQPTQNTWVSKNYPLEKNEFKMRDMFY